MNIAKKERNGKILLMLGDNSSTYKSIGNKFKISPQRVMQEI